MSVLINPSDQTITQHNVLVGGANNTVSSVAPGTTGNVLTSNGTDWTSAAAGGGGATPLFNAYLSGNVNNVTGDTTVYTVAWNSTVYNVGSCFNTSTGVFTAPATGTYLFTGTIYSYTFNNSSQVQSNIDLVTTSTTYYLYAMNPYAMAGNATLVLPFSITVNMSSGNTASITWTVVGNSKDIGVGGLLGLSGWQCTQL